MNATKLDLDFSNNFVQKEWKIKDAKVRANIFLHCSYKQVNLIKSSKTSKEIKNRLESTYK